MISGGTMATYRLPRKDGEEWRPAKLLYYKTTEAVDLLDYYVSNQGRICHKINDKYKLLKLSKTSDGYLTCNIGKTRKKIHRIVASTFLEIPSDIKDPVVDHKDNNKTHNEATNLEWVSVRVNTQLAYDDGLIKKRKMMKVLAVDENEDAILYKNQAVAAEETGIDSRQISRVVRGLDKKAGKYRFVRINNFKDQSS